MMQTLASLMGWFEASFTVTIRVPGLGDGSVYVTVIFSGVLVQMGISGSPMRLY